MSGYSILFKSTPQTSKYFGHVGVHDWFLKGDPQKKVVSWKNRMTWREKVPGNHKDDMMWR